MKNQNLANQIPILKFLSGYKWAILLPIMLSTLYFVFPYDFFQSRPEISDSEKAQSDYFKRASVVFNGEVSASSKSSVDIAALAEIRSLQVEMRSDEFLKELIRKNNLFESERLRGDSLENLSQSLSQWVSTNASIDDSGRIGFSYIVLLSQGDRDKIRLVETHIANKFSNSLSLKVTRIVNEPYVPKYTGSLTQSIRMKLLLLLLSKTALGLMFGIILSISLILLLESPKLFYSKRIREEVFKPIRSDWELEKAETDSRFFAKVLIDIRFVCAFATAMIRRNPVVELFRPVLSKAR